MGFIPRLQGWLNIGKSINVIHHINEIKDKNYTVILIDTEKKLIIQRLFMLKKILKRAVIEGIKFNLIKAII